MSEKVFGITKNILSCQLKKYEVDSILEDSVPVVSVEEFERYKSEAKAVILQKSRKIMEWESQPLVSVERVKEMIKQRPCKSCKHFTEWLKELKQEKGV